MKSLWCKIFGCKWSQFIVTEIKDVYKMTGIDGFGSSYYGWVPTEFGYTKTLSHCSRCGKENPAYEKSI